MGYCTHRGSKPQREKSEYTINKLKKRFKPPRLSANDQLSVGATLQATVSPGNGSFLDAKFEKKTVPSSFSTKKLFRKSTKLSMGKTKPRNGKKLFGA